MASSLRSNESKTAYFKLRLICGFGARHLAVWLAFIVISASRAFAAACPPGYPANLPCPQAAYETVEIEHEDRKNRLSRLSRGAARPDFFTAYLTPAEHGLPEFPVNIPVLRVVFNQNVFFDVGSSVIRPEAYPVLDTIAESLQHEPPDVALFIAGHTDSTGSEEYNFSLGLDRADAVAQTLVRRGIYQASIYRVSFGEAVPLQSNDTDSGRARNRRVEFLFGARPGAIVAWLKKQPVQSCAARGKNEVEECRKQVVFEARKVAIDPVSTQKVVELHRQQESIERDKSLTPTEVERKKENIEIERQKIPVVISHERIPVVIERN